MGLGEISFPSQSLGCTPLLSAAAILMARHTLRECNKFQRTACSYRTRLPSRPHKAHGRFLLAFLRENVLVAAC